MIVLFNYCKQQLYTSPLLVRYDSSKSVFLKTDWYTGEMGYILIQADASPQSLVALILLKDTSEYTFDLSHDGPRLRPVFFGSRSS